MRKGGRKRYREDEGKLKGKKEKPAKTETKRHGDPQRASVVLMRAGCHGTRK